MSSDVLSPCSGERSACVSCTYRESTKTALRPFLEARMVHRQADFKDVGFRHKVFGNGVVLDPDVEELKIVLVGKGDSGDACGEIRFSHLCAVDLKPHYARYKCKRKGCKDCWELWRNDEMYNIPARLLSKDARDLNKDKRLVDMFVSPPPEIGRSIKTRKDVKEFRAAGIRYAKSKGVRGGSSIVHFWRVTHAGKRRAAAANKKQWAWLREQDEWREWCYWSPHLHLLAYVDWLIPPEKGEGWVYRADTDEDGKPVDFIRKAKRSKVIKNVAAYLLSHTGYSEGTYNLHSVTWFGTCAYNKFGLSEEERAIRDYTPVYPCKICGAELVPAYPWLREKYHLYKSGKLPPPRYFGEVEMILAGKMDEIADREDFIIGG